MVQAVRSPHDLDNIHLQEVTCSFGRFLTTLNAAVVPPDESLLCCCCCFLFSLSLIRGFFPGERGRVGGVRAGAPFIGGSLL